jgi:RimJ/RimL family protein N-acetyltransferase
MIELRGRRILLRAFREDEVDAVYEARSTGDLSPWPGGVDRAALGRRLARSGRFVGGRLDLAIELDGRLIGELDARQPPQALPPGVFELGIAIFEAADRGKGIGAEAVALATDYIFRERDAHRVQASTAVDNAPMRRALEKVGFRCEGVMRAFMPAGDERVDYVLYALTKADRDERA